MQEPHILERFRDKRVKWGTVVTQYPLGISTRTHCRYQNPWMFQVLVSPPYLQIPHLWIPPTEDRKCSTESTDGWICGCGTGTYRYIYWKKSVYKWLVFKLGLHKDQLSICYPELRCGKGLAASKQGRASHRTIWRASVWQLDVCPAI